MLVFWIATQYGFVGGGGDTCSSETSVSTQQHTLRYNPEEQVRHLRRQNQISHHRKRRAFNNSYDECQHPVVIVVAFQAFTVAHSDLYLNYENITRKYFLSRISKTKLNLPLVNFKFKFMTSYLHCSYKECTGTYVKDKTWFCTSLKKIPYARREGSY
jgi:hypothetical protein